MKDFLKKAFPFLSVAATAAGGPLGGAIAGVIGKALGTSVDPADLSKVLAQQAMTEEGRLKLEQMESDLKLSMAKLNIESVEEFERVAAADRDSARKREVEVKDNTPRVLAYLIVAAFIGTILAVLMGWSKAESAIAGTLIGYISAKCEQVVSYYFGSSSGSDRKTELLAQSSPADSK